MTEVTDSNFEAEVLKSEMPVVVFFHTPSVSPCRMIEPIVSEIEDSCRGSVKFVKLEIEENNAFFITNNPLSLSTLIFNCIREGHNADNFFKISIMNSRCLNQTGIIIKLTH